MAQVGMSKTYKAYQPEQDLLLPPSLKDWLPEKHLAYFVSDVVDELDLSGIEAVYEKDLRGQPPYDPRMMTKLLVYGYCVGVYSARKMQQRLNEDVAFRVLAAGNAPDFRTIAEFRKIHRETLKGLFEQVLKMALEFGGDEAGAGGLGREQGEGERLEAQGDELRPEGGARESDSAGGERDAGAGRGGGRGGRRALREGVCRERTAGGVAAAGDAAETDWGGEAGVGGAGPREGEEGRPAGEESAAESEGSIQLYRSRVADHEEQQRRVRASLQRADRGGTGVTVNRGAGGHASGQRQRASGADDANGGSAVGTAAGGGDRGQWVLLGEESGDFGIGAAGGAAHRSFYGHGATEAWGTPGEWARAVTERRDAGGAHEAEAADQGRAGNLRGAQRDRGTGVRADQGSAGIPAVFVTGVREGESGMGAGVYNAQYFENVSRLLPISERAKRVGRSRKRRQPTVHLAAPSKSPPPFLSFSAVPKFHLTP